MEREEIKQSFDMNILLNSKAKYMNNLKYSI